MTTRNFERTPDAAAQVADHVFALASRARARVDREILTPAGLNHVQWRLLEHLVLMGLVSPSEIGRSLDIPLATASTALNGLQSLGLIERRVDPRDARRYDLAPSSAGLRLRERLLPRIREAQTREFRLLSHLELHALDSQLEACERRSAAQLTRVERLPDRPSSP